MILLPTISKIASSTLTQPEMLPAMTIAPSSNASPGGESRPGAKNGECKLLGPFALFVQGALGLLALLSLVFKRWRERPQRPVRVWAFDASKQVVGSVLLHIANLLMSMLSSGELTIKANEYQANPCSFYLLNLAMDVSWSTVLYLSIGLLKLIVNIDDYWYSNTCGPPPCLDLCLLAYSAGEPTRIHTFWKLWPSP